MTLIAAYDDEGIWGVGDTAEKAREEALGFINEYIPESQRETEIAKLKFAQMSEELVEALDELVEDYDGVAINIDDLAFTLDPATGELVPDESDLGLPPEGTIDEIADTGLSDPTTEG